MAKRRGNPNWANRLRLAPIRISASLSHEKLPFHSRNETATPSNYKILRLVFRIQLSRCGFFVDELRTKEILKHIAELIGDSVSYSQFNRKVNKKFLQGKSRPRVKWLHIKYLAEDDSFIATSYAVWRRQLPHRLCAFLRLARSAGICRLPG